MGYEDRDYMQEGSSRSSSILPGYPACRWLLFITVGVFIGQIFFTRDAKPADFKRMSKRLHHQFKQLDVDTQVPDPVVDVDNMHDMDSMAPIFSKKISTLEDWFQLDTDRVSRGQIWRLLTYAFVHNRYGVWHIFVNLLLLYWFGRRIERRRSRYC